MTNKDYWARRFKIMEDALKNKDYKYAKNLEKQYAHAIVQIDKEIRSWYQRFADNNGQITLAQANKLLNSDELKAFKWTVEEYIERGREHAISGAWAKELEDASARVHISRFESLKMQLQQHAEELTGVRIGTTTEAATSAYMQSYYHTAYEFQKGFGVGWTMQALDKTTIQKVLSKPWTVDNQTFTARCWTDKDKLVDTVNQELTRMLAVGAAPDKAIDTIAKRFEVSKSNAGRVVMTECAYFASVAQKDCYKELDIEKYSIISALDNKTCELCGEMDGKVFKMSEYQAGATAPPFHPWCRCCTAPFFEDMEGVGERYARDVKTGERYKLPKDTTYEEWKKMQDEKYGSGTVDKIRKMEYNKTADKEQFTSYKARLGKEAPFTFEDFQKLKYDNPIAYNDLCGLYSYKGRVSEATKADYVVYKAVRSIGIYGTVRVPPAQIDTSVLTLDTDHIIEREHNVNFDEAVSYMNNALFSLKRTMGKGPNSMEFINYYADDGAAYVNVKDKTIRTAFKRAEFDSKTTAAVEAAKNAR